MKTPIYDFVKKYAEKNPVRFHMPGHKGKPYLGIEPYDITEINGADVLYSAEGIIAESENIILNIFNYFRCKTFSLKLWKYQNIHIK